MCACWGVSRNVPKVPFSFLSTFMEVCLGPGQLAPLGGAVGGLGFGVRW